MAGQNYTWQVSSPNIGTGVGVISSAYNVDGKSPFTTITNDNPTGFVKVFPNSTSTDLNIKNLEYAIRTDGKIVYRVQNGTQNPPQSDTLQGLADTRGNWSGTTTKQVQTQMNGILSTSAQSNGITPPSPAPSTGDPQAAEATKESVSKGATIGNNSVIKTSDKTRSVTNYKNLRYPISMNTKQDCIQFTMIEYRPRKLSPTGILQGTAQENRKPAQNTQRGSTVTLPIQPTISDANTVRWGAEDMDAFQAIAAATALSTITDGSAGAAASIESIRKLINQSSESLGTAAATYFAGNAAGVKGLLTRVTGGIVNPNTELLFQGPDLRTFNFTFSLSAREPDEAKEIKQIIRFFKQGMSVKRADTGLFLKSPHTFEIKYLHDGKEHPWINKIKECALTSCNVNYTPAGNYATYEDGAMTQYDVSLSFSELEPIYDDDYANEDLGGDNNQDTQIGF